MPDHPVVITMFHGGPLDKSDETLWLSAEHNYAARVCRIWDVDAVWEVTLDLDQDDVLDLTRLRCDARAVAAARREAGIAAPDPAPQDGEFPPAVLRSVPARSVRNAGHRAITVCEWVDWGMAPGRQEAVALYLADQTAIARKRKMPLTGDWNFQAHGGRPSRFH